MHRVLHVFIASSKREFLLDNKKRIVIDYTLGKWQIKIVQKTCTYTCVHISVMNYKMTKKNFPHIHVFQNLFKVNMILTLAVIWSLCQPVF